MRIVSYCLMPNHWHLVLWPEDDGDLGTFMQKLTITHARNWQEHRRRVGFGHLYQGRYKSFPLEHDEHFYQVVRYVERNALRARLVRRAENWRWSSIWALARLGGEAPGCLARGRCRCRARGRNWSTSRKPKRNWRRSAKACCGQPFGNEKWTHKTAELLGLQSTLRPRGRPKFAPE